MNRDDVIRWAEEAGAIHYWHLSNLERFAQAAYEAGAAAENEMCARIAETPSETVYECTVACGGPTQTFTQRFPKDATEIAKLIRARGEKK